MKINDRSINNQSKEESQVGNSLGKIEKEGDKYKIDPSYYFKHLEPKQIDTVLSNF